MQSVVFIHLSVVFFGTIVVPIYCAEAERQVDDANVTKQYTRWDDENKTKLLKIYYMTNTGEKNHEGRIKEKWDRIVSTRKTNSAQNLYKRAKSWIENGDAERLLTEEERQYGNPKIRKMRMEWTSKMKEDILRFIQASDPKERNQMRILKECWDKEYPQYPEVTAQHLIVKVQELQKKNKEVIKEKATPSTMKEKEDLLRCYHMAPKNRGQRLIDPKGMRDFFIREYPQFANVSHKALIRQISHLRNKYPEIDDRISKEVSASFTDHHSWLPGEASGARQEEPTSIATFQTHDFPAVSEQYFDSNRDNAWINHMIQESPIPNFHTIPDVITSHQNIYPEAWNH